MLIKTFKEYNAEIANYTNFGLGIINQLNIHSILHNQIDSFNDSIIVIFPLSDFDFQTDSTVMIKIDTDLKCKFCSYSNSFRID